MAWYTHIQFVNMTMVICAYRIDFFSVAIEEHWRSTTAKGMSNPLFIELLDGDLRIATWAKLNKLYTLRTPSYICMGPIAYFQSTCCGSGQRGIWGSYVNFTSSITLLATLALDMSGRCMLEIEHADIRSGSTCSKTYDSSSSVLLIFWTCEHPSLELQGRWCT